VTRKWKAGDATARPFVRLPGSSSDRRAANQNTLIHSRCGRNSWDEDKRNKMLNEHALSIRKHIKDLSSTVLENVRDLPPRKYVDFGFASGVSFLVGRRAVAPSLIEIGDSQKYSRCEHHTAPRHFTSSGISGRKQGESLVEKRGRKLEALRGTLRSFGKRCPSKWNQVGRI